MGLDQQQKSGATETPVSPPREDVLSHGQNAKATGTETGEANTGALKTQLSGAFAEMGDGGNPLGNKLTQWKPRIQKVTNPVAMMTSAAEKDDKVYKGQGNYDKAIMNKSAADGFYELAKTECAALASEILIFSGQPSLSPVQKQQVKQLSMFMEAYQQLYATLQATGSSRHSSKREAMTEVANSAIMDVRAARGAISNDFLGESTPLIDKSINDISLFVNTWSSVSASSETNNASPAMWASFLQTVERYRQILNRYDKLEEAGGDATGTAKMSMRKDSGAGIKDVEEADAKATDEGGYMAMALKSYGFYTQDAARMVEQLKEIIVKVQSGEYATEEECVAAFRAHVGGGGSSELFLKKLDNVSKTQWSIYKGELNNTLSNEARVQATVDQQSSLGALSNADGSVSSRDQHARNADENHVFLGMSNEDVALLGQLVKSGKVDLLDPEVIAQQKFLDDLNASNQEMHANQWDKTMYSQSNPNPAESTFVYTHAPAFLEMDDFTLGKGAMSKQENAYREMDKEGADQALKDALVFNEKAQEYLTEADVHAKGANGNIQLSAQYLMKGQQYLAEAKLRLTHINGDHPALIAGLNKSEAQIQQLKSNLADSKELLLKVREYQVELDNSLAASRDKIVNYDPAKLKVPVPSAEVNGQKLELESFQKLTIDLSGPAFGIFWWLGGVEGEYSQTSTLGEDDVWSKARIEAYVGLEADLWLARAGVKILGFFEAEKKNADGLMDTIESGAEELGRWAYAWYYGLSSMGKRLLSPIRGAIQHGDGVYDNLIKNSQAEDWEGVLSSSENELREVYRNLSNELGSALSMSGGVADGERMAMQVMPLDDIIAGLKALETAPEEEREDQARAEKSGFDGTANTAKNEAAERIAQVDPGTNDPNVKFEAGVGIEGYASIGTKSGSMKLGVSARKVWSISDGDGDSFDLGYQTKTLIKMGLNVGDISGELSYEPKVDGADIGMEIAFPIPGDAGVDGSKVLTSLASDIASIATSAGPQAWLEAIKDRVGKNYDIAELSKVKSEGKVECKIGAKVNLNNSNELTGGEVSLAIVASLGAGNKFVAVSYEQGNKVTYVF